MGSQKRNAFLVGALLLLVLIAYASGTFDSAPSTVRVPQFDFEAGEIQSIEVVKPEFSLKAERSGGTWQLTEPEAWLADSSLVASFARTVSNLEFLSVVSTSPERYTRYGVDSTGAEVILTSDADELHLIVSSEGPDFSSNYVRTGSDERVFVASPRLSLPTDANRWKNRIVTSVPEHSVESMEVASPEGDYSLERAESGWTYRDANNSTPADSATAATFFRTYSSLRADGFLSADALTDSLVHRVSFVLTGGQEATFTVSELENELAVQYSGEPRGIYRFFTSRKTALVPTPDAMRGDD